MCGPAYRSYMICTVPRSGSTLLCGLLAGTQVAGNPDSHFHAPSLDRWLDSHGLKRAAFASRQAALATVFAAAQARGRGDSAVFGLRMQRGSLDHFLQQLAVILPGRASDLARIETAFGRTLFVHLSRADRLGQAISRVRAEQTGLWHRRSDGTELERQSPHREPWYDAAAIARHMAELAALDASWERWFAQESLRPLRIGYDSLAQDPQMVLAEVLQALGLDAGHARTAAPPTARLAEDESQRWRRRFEAEQGTGRG